MTSDERYCSSNHRQLNWLFNRLLLLTTKRTPKLRITGPLWGESTGDRSIFPHKNLLTQKEFPWHDVIMSVCATKWQQNKMPSRPFILWVADKEAGQAYRRINVVQMAVQFVRATWENAISLRWRHNGRKSISNHQPYDCLLNLLFGRRSK